MAFLFINRPRIWHLLSKQTNTYFFKMLKLSIAKGYKSSLPISISLLEYGWYEGYYVLFQISNSDNDIVYSYWI